MKMATSKHALFTPILMKIICLCILLLLTSLNHSIYACTIFSCALKGEVLVGANEDMDNPFSKVWFNPSTKDRYGSVCFGFPDMQPQAALNEHGLFVDFTAQSGIDPASYHLQNPYFGDLFFEILGRCKNVEEALEFLQTHDYTFYSQALLADAQGNSIVINAGAKMAKKGNYQINTNFNILQLASKDYQCRRYDMAEQMLSTSTQISVPYFRQILSMTRQEGMYPTQYSNIYDLKRGLIYVYLYHNFEQVYVIDLQKELKKGYRVEPLSRHFSPSFPYEEMLKTHAEYPREVLLAEIDSRGIDNTLDRYKQIMEQTTNKDSLRYLLVDAGMVLIKKSHNRYTKGAGWYYLLDFPTSYTIWHAEDQEIKVAFKIWEYVLERSKPNEHLLVELYAYLNLVKGNKEKALDYYQKLLTSAPKESDSYRRGKKILEKINL
jgi:hypothetical protein